MTRSTKRRALWTSVKSSLKPNGFGAEKKERKRIKPRSKAMEQRMRVYRKQREDFLRRHRWCEVYPYRLSKDVHHKLGRGKHLLDEKTWMAVSREAHDTIHRNPAWAYEHGYLERRG